MKIAIGYITHGLIQQDFVNNLMNLLFSGLPITNVCSYQTAYIPKGRCEVVKQFLATECDYLLFLDTDVIVKPEDVKKMIDHTSISKIISGIYYNTQPTTLGNVILPCIYRDGGKEKPFSLITDIPEEGYLKISAAGFGLILIHRDIYEEMAKNSNDPWPWFGHDIYQNERLGEDLTFFLRAKEKGIDSAIAVMDVKAKHLKIQSLNSSDMGVVS